MQRFIKKTNCGPQKRIAVLSVYASSVDEKTISEKVKALREEVSDIGELNRQQWLSGSSPRNAEARKIRDSRQRRLEEIVQELATLTGNQRGST